MTRRFDGVLLAACVFVGLLWPALASAARPLLMPSIFVLLVATLLTLDLGDVGRALAAQGRLLALICLWQQVGAPLATIAVLWTLPVSEEMRMVLLLSACACPIFSAPAFARLLHLDAPLMTAIVLVTTITMPLALAMWSALMLSEAADLDMGEYFMRLLLFIVLPLLLATAVRRFLGTVRLTTYGGSIHVLLVVALAVFALAVMDGVSARLVADPALVGGFLLVAVLYNVSSQALTAVVFSAAGTVCALTSGLAAGYRNLALVLAMTGSMVGPDFGIYVGVAQIPIYVLPLILTPLYRRLTRPGTSAIR